MTRFGGRPPRRLLPPRPLALRPLLLVRMRRPFLPRWRFPSGPVATSPAAEVPSAPAPPTALRRPVVETASGLCDSGEASEVPGAAPRCFAPRSGDSAVLPPLAPPPSALFLSASAAASASAFCPCFSMKYAMSQCTSCAAFSSSRRVTEVGGMNLYFAFPRPAKVSSPTTYSFFSPIGSPRTHTSSTIGGLLKRLMVNLRSPEQWGKLGASAGISRTIALSVRMTVSPGMRRHMMRVSLGKHEKISPTLRSPAGMIAFPEKAAPPNSAKSALYFSLRSSCTITSHTKPVRIPSLKRHVCSRGSRATSVLPMTPSIRSPSFWLYLLTSFWLCGFSGMSTVMGWQKI